MPIGYATTLVLLTAGLLAEGHAWHSRFWTLLALLPASTFIAKLVQEGLKGALFFGLGDLLLALGLLALALLLLADAVGLPRPVAIRLGIGIRSRAWEFDKLLFDARQEAVEAMREAALVESAEQDSALDRARAALRRVRALRPPNDQWKDLRDALVETDEQWVDLVAARTPPKPGGELEARQLDLNALWGALRDQYIAEGHTARRSRGRGRAIWLLAPAIFTGCTGMGALIFEGWPSIALDDPRVWFGAACLATSVVLLAAAAIEPFRHRGSPEAGPVLDLGPRSSSHDPR